MNLRIVIAMQWAIHQTKNIPSMSEREKDSKLNQNPGIPTKISSDLDFEKGNDLRLYFTTVSMSTNLNEGGYISGSTHPNRFVFLCTD